MTQLEEDLAASLRDLIYKVEDIRGVDIHFYAGEEITRATALVSLHEAEKLKRNARIKY
jgi:hypothetical protein